MENTLFSPLAKEVMFLVAFACVSVGLSASSITQKAMNWMQ